MIYKTFVPALMLALLLPSLSSFAAPLKVNVNLSTKGNDIAFDATSIQVPFGRDIHLGFSNQAAKDSEILHNIAVLSPGSLERVLKAFQESDYDVDKIRKHKDVLAMTPTLKPGVASVLKISKSKLNKKGYYPYVCLMPGHADVLGMKGIMNVQ